MKAKTHFFISRSFLLRMRNVSDKIVEKIKTHLSSSVIFFLNRAVYEIMWKVIVQRGRPQITILGMGIACWIPKATNAHSQYVTLIAFPLQQSLHESASMLRYTYIACLFLHCNDFLQLEVLKTASGF
jgi:hypothetical protein